MSAECGVGLGDLQDAPMLLAVGVVGPTLPTRASCSRGLPRLLEQRHTVVQGSWNPRLCLLGASGPAMRPWSDEVESRSVAGVPEVLQRAAAP